MPVTAEAVLLLLVAATAAFAVAEIPVLPGSHPKGLHVGLNTDQNAIAVYRSIKKDDDKPAPSPSPAPENATARPTPTASTAPPMTMTGKINIIMGSIRELDNNETEVGDPKHVSTDFVQLGSFVEQRLGQLEETKVADTQVQLTCQAYTAPPLSFANDTNEINIKVKLCAVKTNGSLTVTGETIPLKEGQLWFGFEIRNWPWVGSDDDSKKGKYLEMKLMVGVAEAHVITRDGNGMPLKVSMGASDSYAILASKVRYQPHPMQNGYPKLSVTDPAGPTANVTVRLPRPSSSTDGTIEYGVVVEPGYLPGPPGPVSAAERVVVPMTTLALIYVAWVAIFRRL